MRYDMQLNRLASITDGLKTLAEIEREHPTLGAQLLNFVTDVGKSCDDAYTNFSRALALVQQLPIEAQQSQTRRVIEELTNTYSSTWFRDIAQICNRLEVVGTMFGPALEEQRKYAQAQDDQFNEGRVRDHTHKGFDIARLMLILSKKEGELKDDIRWVVTELVKLLSPSEGPPAIGRARELAAKVQGEIVGELDTLQKLEYQIRGSSTTGIQQLLSPAQIAENALRRPERVLILNMFFLLVALTLAATVFRYLSIPQFVLATGFALTAVVVVNAFYLRSIDGLSEESFLKLMQLALLKFFAPLTRKSSSPKG